MLLSVLGIHHVKTLYTFPFWVYIKHVVKVVFDILKIKIERGTRIRCNKCYLMYGIDTSALLI